MNGRQRILNLLDHQPIDRPAWNALVDFTSLRDMPAEFQALDGVEFCRAVGADVLQLGDFSLPPEKQVGDPFRTIQPGIMVEEMETGNGLWLRRTITPWGCLLSTLKQNHPLKYPVETLADLRIFRRVWENTCYEEAGPEWEDRYWKADAYVGESGIYTHFFTSSPVQRLIEFDLGLVNFYSLLQDHRAEMEGLLEVMQARWLESVEILARRTPGRVIIPVENTSTTLISPALYARYSLPQLQSFVQIAHNHGKKAVLHMCGWLKNLLPFLKETDLDGIHALTPPTIGDTPFELARQALGEGVTLMGLLDGTVFHDPQATAGDLWALLDRIYTPEVRQGNFMLIVAADGLPTPLWKFQAVQEWMEKHACP